MQTPDIREVAIRKQGRHWVVETDGCLLAVVLYRKGAEAIQALVQRLAGLPTASPPKGFPPGSAAAQDKPVTPA